MKAKHSLPEHVVRLAARGWKIFPIYGTDGEKCDCGRSGCSNPGKHPITNNGFRDATNDLETLKKWWRKNPSANVGVAMAESGLLAIDMDNRHKGEETLAKLEERNEVLPPTYSVATGNGCHFYFQHPGVRVSSSVGRLGPGLDVRADGGYVVAAGSRHWTGNEYVESNPAEPTVLPDWLLNLLTQAPKRSTTGGVPDLVGDGQRNQALTSLAGSMRRIGISQDGIILALLKENQLRCTPPLPESEVKNIAQSISRYAPSSDVFSQTLVTPSWPEPLHKVAMHGLAGEVVHTIEPHSESDPAALLVQTHVAFGSIIGRGARFSVESTYHHMNLFAVLVGQTAKARKGTSWEHIQRICSRVDRDWVDECIKSGLASGEGLIWNTRDPDPAKEDPGARDKRLLDMESEFASVLQVMAREGNTVSAVIRQAWDSGILRILNKNSPAVATGAHISVIGHITAIELKRHITQTEMGNGFANRFLWVAVSRSKALPEGGRINDRKLAPLVKQLKLAVEFAKKPIDLRRDLEAKFLWHEVYEKLSEGSTGLFGAVTSRAEAQVMRLASIYALLDRSELINRCHLEAALALWRYAEDSAKYIFGDALGDPTADEALNLLKSAGAQGKTRSEINTLFGRHKSSADIGRALNLLASAGLAHYQIEKTEGRPVERWFVFVQPEKSRKAAAGAR